MISREPPEFIFPLLKTPNILLRVGKLLFNKHFAARREFKRGDGYSRLPIQLLSIKITNACNLRCKTCGQWGETGYNFSKPVQELKKTVPLSRYLELSNEVKKDRPVFYIWGGEPFLYPDLFEFTAKIKANKSILAVVTNATRLEESAADVVKQGWDALMFSLDGREGIHDRVRGKAGTFEKVARGIEAVQRQKRDNKKTLPWIIPLITINTLNADKLDEILEAAKSLDTDCAVVYYSWFADSDVGERHTHVFQKHFGITPTAWQGYLFDHNVDVEALIESKKRITSRRWGFPIIYIPDLEDSDLRRYYSEPGNFFGYGPCISPWMGVELMPNGDVATCRDYPDFITGSILTSRLYEIWNGARYVEFRKALHDAGGTFPGCARCCGLMGW
jgi:MoaA/NifB/PqqE/SkfB family radical SAM enzyme